MTNGALAVAALYGGPNRAARGGYQPRHRPASLRSRPLRPRTSRAPALIPQPGQKRTREKLGAALGAMRGRGRLAAAQPSARCDPRYERGVTPPLVQDEKIPERAVAYGSARANCPDVCLTDVLTGLQVASLAVRCGTRSWRNLRRHGRRVLLGESRNRIVLDRGPELIVERHVRYDLAAYGPRGRGHEGRRIGGQAAELPDE